MNTHFSHAYQQRFSGIERLYGHCALILFLQAHICVIGMGGGDRLCFFKRNVGVSTI